MLKLEEYSKLPRIKQEIVLMEQGEFIDSIREGIFAYALYGLHLFYVEIVYRRSTNKIVSINAFDADDDRIDFYSKGRKL